MFYYYTLSVFLVVVVYIIFIVIFQCGLMSETKTKKRLKLKIIGSYEIFHVSLHLWRSLRKYLGERKPQQRSLFSADIHQINFRVELKPSLCAPLGL